MNKTMIQRRIFIITLFILFMLYIYLCMSKIEEPIETMKTIPAPEIQVTTLMMEAEPTMKEEPTDNLRAERCRTTPDLYTLEEKEVIARVVHAEARGECFKGQIAVAQVVINRYESGKFGDSLKHITRRSQFARSKIYNDENLRAVNEAISTRPLPDTVMYFQKANRRIWGNDNSIVRYCTIEGHTFYEQRR